MATVSYSRWHVFSRICASILGSYAFAWGFIAIVVASLIGAGLEFHEAQSLTFMLGLLLFLWTFCWAFIAASITRVWVILAGGGAVMTLAGWWISRLVA